MVATENRFIGRYEAFLLLAYSVSIAAVHWMAVTVLFIVPDQQFAPQNGTNFSFRCESIDLEDSKEILFDNDQFDFTATERYRLVCDRHWYRNVTKSAYLLGFLIGALCSGILSDKYGRRPVLLTTSVAAIVLNIASIFSPNIELYIVLRLALGVCHMAVFISGMITCCETLPQEKRFLVLFVDNLVLDLTTAAAGGSSYLARDYRYHHAISAGLYATGLILFLFFALESPRWLLSTNQPEKCAKLIQKISSRNNLDPKYYDYLRISPITGSDETKRGNVLDLFRTPVIRKRTLILMPIWIAAVTGVHGIQHNFNIFTHDVRRGLVILGLVRAPLNIPIFYLIQAFGRQVCLFGAWVVMIGLSLGMVPLSYDRTALALTVLAALGNVTVEAALAATYLLTQELFPTVIRQTGLGTCSTAGRMVSFLSPEIVLLNAYWPPATVVILLSLATLAAILVPALPDTTGTDLLQTVQDGEDFMSKHRYRLILPQKLREEDEREERTADAERLSLTGTQ